MNNNEIIETIANFLKIDVDNLYKNPPPCGLRMEHYITTNYDGIPINLCGCVKDELLFEGD